VIRDDHQHVAGDRSSRGDGHLHLFDASTGAVIRGPIVLGTSPIVGLAFSPDGRTVVTSDRSGTVETAGDSRGRDATAMLGATVGLLNDQDWNTYAPDEIEPTALPTCDAVNVSRWWWMIVSALVVAGVVWLAIQVAVLGQTARDDASTYGAFALTLPGVGIPIVRWAVHVTPCVAGRGVPA
jgi:hypothetical protein